MQKFHGYRVRSKNLGQIETILGRARATVHEAATEEYHRLLSDEISELVDDVAMNIRPRPDCSIREAAQSTLNQRIMDAENFSTGTEYDLRAGVQIIPEGDDYTYFILSVSNPLLEEAFASTPEIEDYTTPLETDQFKGVEATPQSAKWEAINKRYNGETPMLSASLTSVIDFDAARLRAIDKNTRAAVRARRHLTTLLLNRYACGKNIPNDQLMRMLDLAFLRLTSESETLALERTTTELLQILPDYTISDILLDPRQAAAVQTEDCDA